MTSKRFTSRRQDPNVLAEDAKRLLRDPVFQRAIVDEEQRIMVAIADGVSDGSPEFEAQERELCRELRTLQRLKARILYQPQNQQLRDAGFRSSSPEQD